jgi:hypothetical protein
MTGVVTISPSSVVDGEGREVADQGLSAAEAMEASFATDPIWQTPQGQQGMAKLRALAASRQQQPFTGPAAPTEAQQKALARIEELKADREFGARWVKGDADAVRELEDLHVRAYGGKASSNRAASGHVALDPARPQLSAAQKAAAAVLNDHVLAEKARNGDEAARAKIAAATRALP